VSAPDVTGVPDVDHDVDHLPLLRGDGVEWVVEAFGCDAERLTSRDRLAALVAELVADLALRPVAPAAWHQFPPPGGITGMVLLAESHLALHTFPEHQSLTLNLFCCRPREEWDFAAGLARHVGAGEVRVRRVERQYAQPMAPV
jgi:S-adenosylmethionine decarboxylase